MIELSIPQPGEESRQAKDLVFSILSKEQPLSLIELSNRIKIHFNVSMTYQAVRKAVDTLVKQSVLVKQGKHYSISKEWILKLKSFFDQLLSDYDGIKSVHSFKNDMAKENYAVYTLHSLYELDTFWADILLYLAKNMKDDEPRNSMNYGHYTWWMLINLGSETKLYEQYKKMKIDTYFIWLRDLPLNKWSAQVYRDLGHKVIVKELDDVDELVAVNTVGDTILQVKYPKEIVRKVRKFFEKYKSVQEMSMKEITEIAHSPCEIKFIIFKNSTIARNIFSTYHKLFYYK